MNDKKLAIILSYVKMFIGILIAFTFTPYLLAKLGDSEYGIYVLAGAFISYLTMLDLGMNDSVVRHLIKDKGSPQQNKVFSNIMAIYLCISLLALLVGYIGYDYLDILLSNKFAQNELFQFKKIYWFVIALTALTLLANPLSATLIAAEKFVFIRTVEIALMICSVISMFLVLQYYNDAYSLFMVSCFYAIVSIVVKVLYSFLFLDTKIIKTKINWYLLKPIIVYALPILVVVISEQIYWKLDNLLIASFLGPSYLTIYAIGLMFHKYFMSFATTISRVMMPSVIRTIDQNSTLTKVVKQLVEVSRLQAIVVILIMLGLIVVGDDFISLWIGDKYLESYYVLLWVMIPYSIELIGNLRNTVLQVKGLYWYRGCIVLFTSIINILLTIYLLHKYGVIGAAVSTGLCLLLNFILTHVVLYKKLNFNLKVYFLDTYKGFIQVITVVLSISFVLNSFLQNSWFALFIQTCLIIVVYFLCCWVFVFDMKKRSYFANIFFVLRDKLQSN